MTPPRIPSPTPDHAGARLEARRDQRQRDIVDDALSLMGVAGTLSALEFLKAHAVEGRVITRVLLDPARRRGSKAFAA